MDVSKCLYGLAMFKDVNLKALKGREIPEGMSALCN